MNSKSLPYPLNRLNQGRPLYRRALRRQATRHPVATGSIAVGVGLLALGAVWSLFRRRR